MRGGGINSPEGQRYAQGVSKPQKIIQRGSI